MQRENRKDVIKQRRHSKPRPLPLGRAPEGFYPGSDYNDLESSTQVVSQNKQQRQAWKTLNQVQGDGPVYYNNNAFTLIELLVVVLIIGILAAVALPQYQLAVDKARFSKLRALVSSYIQAAHVFYQANGTYPGNIEETDIDFPAGMTFVSRQDMSCAYNQEIYCCINQNSVSSAVASVTCGQKDMTFALRAVPSTSKQVCIAALDNSRAQKLCKAVGGGISADGQTIWPTPSGFSSGSLYRLPD